ncbi:MAG: site-2 protease family protein [Treponema sp.]|jgi:Zn-dependent protease|nr:site-2 protease family protein [Treponema sp.]
MDWRNTLYAIPGILLGLTVHEFCHAFCAWKLGDSTAREQGRLTLNPLKHIDIIGFLFIIIAGFGWAKPVMFDPENLRRPRRDKALIAAAGPLSNMALGILLGFIVRAVFYYHIQNYIYFSDFMNHLFYVLLSAAAINFGLFIFNLLPIPPLDGSHIVFSGLNLRPEIEAGIRKIGMPLLLLIIIFQNYANITIIPISNAVEAIMNLFFLDIG